MSPKVLIVEDNPDSRNYLAALLRVKGFEVDTAEDGLEGMRHALAGHPDVIISDISMPRVDGIQMLRALRKSPECGSTPIVAVSAYGSGKLEDAAKAGADYTLRKPLNCDLLLKAITRLLGKSSPPQGAGQVPGPAA